MDSQPLPQITQPEHQNKKAMIVLGAAILIFGITGILYFRTFSKELLNAGTNTQQPSVYPTEIYSPTAFVTPSPYIEKPYTKKITFYTINESGIEVKSSVIVEPSRVFSSKPSMDGIGGSVYLIDKDAVVTYSLAAKKKTVIYTNELPNKELANVFFKYPDSLYLTESSDLYSSDNTIKEPSSMREIKFVDGSTRIIENLNTVLYGGQQYLFKSSNGDIIGTFGGDGCGGFGRIYRYVEGSSPLELVKTGEGCSEDPRYLGVLEDQEKLVLLSVIPNTFPETKLDTLFTQHAITGERETLLDFKNATPPPEKIIMNEEKTKIISANKNLITIINFDTKEVEKTIPLDNMDLYFLWMVGDKIYSADYQKNTHLIIDIPTGEKQVISYRNNFYPTGNSPQYLGQWNGEPIFYAFE